MLDWCQRHGWSKAGDRGSGHIGLRHTSGVTAVISSTPSDIRSRRNEKAMLLRLSGGHEDKPRAAHFSKKIPTGGLTATYAKPATAGAPWLVAARQIKRVDAELLSVSPRSERARELARERLMLESQLRAAFQPVPPRPKVF